MLSLLKRLFAGRRRQDALTEELQFLIERHGDDVKAGIERELANPNMTKDRRTLLAAARERLG